MEQPAVNQNKDPKDPNNWTKEQKDQYKFIMKTLRQRDKEIDKYRSEGKNWIEVLNLPKFRWLTIAANQLPPIDFKL